MAKRRMKEKDAIVISGVLGAAVLFLLLLVINPFEKEAQKVAESVPTATPEVMTVVSPSGVTVTGSSVISDSTVVTGPVTIVNPAGGTLAERINTPAGFYREEAENGSFTEFLRGYKLKKDGKPVLLYNKTEKANQDAHVAVFKLPLEKEDLQQCADSVMRLYAEYYYATDQKDKISFKFVNGFDAVYARWREGYRIQIGDTTSWVAGGTYDDSYDNFKKYMRMVFAYSSTLSMKMESKAIKLSKLDVGDVFLEAGSPGHVVVVVDVCVNEEGKKAFLLGQGYMPAQEFHLLKNPLHEEDPWYYEDEVSYPFQTPEYTFEKGSLRRLEY